MLREYKFKDYKKISESNDIDLYSKNIDSFLDSIKDFSPYKNDMLEICEMIITEDIKFYELILPTYYRIRKIEKIDIGVLDFFKYYVNNVEEMLKKEISIHKIDEDYDYEANACLKLARNYKYVNRLNKFKDLKNIKRNNTWN